MKKCRIAILMASNHQFHCSVANAIRRILGNNTQPFTVTLVTVALTQDAISNKVIQKINDYDVFLAIGQRCSVYLKEATRDLVDGPGTIFIGIPDPVKLGLIDSLEIPGGKSHAIIRQPADPLDAASKITLLAPNINKVIIPYWPAGGAGTLTTQVKLISDFFKEKNIKLETIPVLEKTELLEALKRKVQRHDVVLLLEGGAGDAHREIAYLCWERKAIFCSDSVDAIELGAACTFSGCVYGFAEELERVLTSFWIDKEQLGLIPVSVIPNNRIFAANIALFNQARFPEESIEALLKTIDTNFIVERWVGCPL